MRLNSANERAEKIFIFIIYFIVQFIQTYDNGKLKRRRKLIRCSIQFTPVSHNPRRRKSCINSLQFNKTSSHKWAKSDIWNDAIVFRFESKFKQIYICTFLNSQRNSQLKLSWHWKWIAACTQLDNNGDKFSTEISEVVSSIFGCIEFASWFMLSERCNCWKFMTKWTGNMKSYWVKFLLCVTKGTNIFVRVYCKKLRNIPSRNLMMLIQDFKSTWEMITKKLPALDILAKAAQDLPFHYIEPWREIISQSQASFMLLLNLLVFTALEKKKTFSV